MGYVIFFALCVCLIMAFPVLIARQWEAYHSTPLPARVSDLSGFITLIAVLVIVVALFTAGLIKVFVIGI